MTADSIRKEQSYHKAEHVVYDSAKVGKAPAKKKSTKKKAEESAEARRSPRRPPARHLPQEGGGDRRAAVEKTEE